MRAWQLQEAKNKLSSLVDKAQSHGPQIITRRGVEVAVVLSYRDYSKLKWAKQSLSNFFQQSPLADLSIERDKSKLRDIDALSP